MGILDKTKLIGAELKSHLPFTLLGASTGIVFMLLFRGLGKEHAQTLFSVFHPLHVMFSAMVTAALFEIHRKAKSFLLILIIGVVGSIGVATMSDCVLPYFGESILGAAIPTHAALHDHEDGQKCEENHDEHHAQLHLGFIEEWYLVFPAALIGVLLAYFKPATHLPHASHVLLSTWASSAHILMNTEADMTATLLAGVFIVLFLAVWLPCCVSDIVFPLLFIGSDEQHHPHSCVFCRKKGEHNES
jgi:hypothetical protein